MTPAFPNLILLPTSNCPPLTFNPVRNVPIPSESTFVTSWYVSVPAILTLPVNVADAAAIAPAFSCPTNVDTPDTFKLSSSVCPSTSMSEFISSAPA